MGSHCVDAKAQAKGPLERATRLLVVADRIG
jgi:hypothetical protein